ncbi:hypothetical protein EU514_21765 [Pseudomonas fragi]|nr:hypothetical protein [Pseudomonas fragi]
MSPCSEQCGGEQCGSGLARDAGGAVCQLNRGAAKPTPTGCVSPCSEQCGSGLARDAGRVVCQLNEVLPSQLPQVVCRLAVSSVGAGLLAMRAGWSVS